VSPLLQNMLDMLDNISPKTC